VRTKLLIPLLALTSSACYQYFPVRESAPLPKEGTEVRILLEDPQELDLGLMTISEVNRLEGHVRESSSDSLSIFSNQLRTYYGMRQFTNGAVFTFDRSQFGRLEERKMVPWKTGVAIGLAAVGLGVGMYYAVGLGGGSEPIDQAPDPTFAHTVNIPLLKVLAPLLFP